MNAPAETPQQAARRLFARHLRNGFEPVALHAYTDAAGAVLFWKPRLKHADGRKVIMPMRRNGHGFELGEPELPSKPLYRLHEIASRPDEPVVVTEGENKADALARLGILATTSGGADSAEKADWSPLEGRAVTIWPDNDEAGERYAQAVAGKLHPLGCTVRIIEAARLELARKGDAVDWLAAHPDATAADVWALPAVEVREPPSNEPGADWPDPEPLPKGLPPVPAFDPALLPEALRPWIEDIAERMACPPDYPAIGALAVLAAVVGRRIGIRPKRRDDWLVVPNLWGAIVGRPGVLKTPALEEAMRPLGGLAAQARESHAKAMQKHGAQAELTKARRDLLRGELRAKKDRRDRPAILADLEALDGQNAEPVEVRYLTNDPTVEKLGELLAANPAGLLVFRDELTGWLRSLDRDGHENDRAFYLEAWAGTGGYVYDRIGRGTLHIPAACVSVLGGIQPGPLAAYVREAHKDGRGADGLLQRFQLLVWPDEPAAWRNVDRGPDSEAKNAAFAVYERLATLDAGTLGAQADEGSIPFVRFDADAQEAFDAWRTELETMKLRRGEPEAIESHLAKYRSLVPSLALLIHLADSPAGGPVGEASMLRAADWAEYLEAHARRAYAEGLGSDLAAAHRLAERIRRGDVADGAKPKDIYLKGWSGLDKETTYRALDVLAECEWLRLEEIKTGGRPSTVIRLNPRLKEVAP